MAKFLVRYTHVEETTYEQWIDANNEDEVYDKIHDEANFEDVVDVCGIEIKDIEILEEEEE